MHRLTRAVSVLWKVLEAEPAGGGYVFQERIRRGQAPG